MKQREWGFVTRKVFHILINGTVAGIAYFINPELVFPVTAGFFVLVVLFELIRLKTAARKEINNKIRTILKKKERKTLTGVFWISAGSLVVAPIATPFTFSYAFAVFALSDPLAALVGRFRPSRQFYRGKTINGTAVFLVTSFFISFFYLLRNTEPEKAAVSSLILAPILTAVEVFSYPLDDNFTLPIVGVALFTSIL
jgi:dolichol kinase